MQRNNRALFARLRAPLLAVGLVLLVAQSAQAAQVSTIAGSGAWGSQDGSAPLASFMMPAGIAIDRNNSAFISDAGAQRIRELSAGGVVRTIAGTAAAPAHGLSVEGGYADGPAAQARFNHPTGVAVDGSGNVYVADTFNHCVRKITPHGTVSTYAGSRESGYVDGPRLVARFRQPEGLAIDRAGNLYVADVATGLRKISVSGVVTTIKRQTTESNQAVGVALYDTENGPDLFVGERFGLLVLRADGTAERFPGAVDFDQPQPAVPKGMLRLIQARRPIGFPTALAAIDDHTVAFADARTNSIRILELAHRTLRITGGQPIDDASGDTGGFRDGEARDSLFDAPLGIALGRNGELLVADAGNRRIRAITGVDYRHAVAPAVGLLDLGFAPSRDEYRIAYVGNSAVWYNTEWPDSIEGSIEASLNRDHILASRAIRVIGIAGNEKLGVATQYAEWLAKIGTADLVVLQLNTGNLVSSFADAHGTLPPVSAWEPQMIARLAELRKQLSARGVPLVVVTHPFPNEFDHAESAYTHVTQDYSGANDLTGTAINDAVRRSGAALIDLWPNFYDYERQPVHAALFGGDDFHFSKNGRMIVGQWVSSALEQLAPWNQKPAGATAP